MDKPVAMTLKDLQPPKAGEAREMKDIIGTKTASGPVYLGSFSMGLWSSQVTSDLGKSAPTENCDHKLHF